jgi:membrane protein YqaA with SNARE-associated domain
MWWQYLLVFAGSMLVDVSPLPLPPAFTVMILLQVIFDLQLWMVIAIGVAGSILGRYVLTLYIPKLSGKYFRTAKQEDAEFLGEKLKANPRKSIVFVLIYSLLPLPTTPLFVAAGMANLNAYQILPGFIVGKLISDTIAVLTGRYAADNTRDLASGMVSWTSVAGLIAGLLLVFVFVFVDWKTLLQKKKFVLNFHIWKSPPT